MTKRYKILQKKLKELESELNQVFALSQVDTPLDQHISQDIENKFLFLNNLLSAEIASSPQKPYHLQHIAQRLLELDAAFHQNLAPDDVDKGWACSCTESCLNDDGEAEDVEGLSTDLSLGDLEEVAEASTVLSLAGLDFDDLVDELVPPVRPAVEKRKEETSSGVVETESEEEAEGNSSRLREIEQRNGNWVGKYLRTLVSGVVLGMVFMGALMVRFNGCFDHESHYTFYLAPT
ncbi:hypothetical protein CCACVL1_05711 [Corchorus capsularis]|uniref:DUF7610 domain-containing protein n=1 Tax=Corchorus capsularis TaxID=210143 RepID=A0A1R3JJ82_COCAP|nr:hypothetical protein CCACVL1_05711 [Corchorus capsularis]